MSAKASRKMVKDASVTLIYISSMFNSFFFAYFAISKITTNVTIITR